MDNNLASIVNNVTASLPDEMLQLLYSGKIGRLVDGLTVLLSLTPIQSAQLSNQVHMLFMGLIKMQDLDNFLRTALNLNEDQIETVWAGLDSGLFTDEIYFILKSIDEAGENDLPTTDLQSEIAEAEAALNQVSPIRTLHSDQADATYTASTQASLLNEAEPRDAVAPVPVPPRLDTDK